MFQKNLQRFLIYSKCQNNQSSLLKSLQAVVLGARRAGSAAPSVFSGLHSCHRGHLVPIHGPSLLQGALALATGRKELYFLSYFVLKQEYIQKRPVPQDKTLSLSVAAMCGLIWRNQALGNVFSPHRGEGY